MVFSACIELMSSVCFGMLACTVLLLRPVCLYYVGFVAGTTCYLVNALIFWVYLILSVVKYVCGFHVMSPTESILSPLT